MMNNIKEMREVCKLRQYNNMSCRDCIYYHKDCEQQCNIYSKIPASVTDEDIKKNYNKLRRMKK